MRGCFNWTLIFWIVLLPMLGACVPEFASLASKTSSVEKSETAKVPEPVFGIQAPVGWVNTDVAIAFTAATTVSIVQEGHVQMDVSAPCSNQFDLYNQSSSAILVQSHKYVCSAVIDNGGKMYYTPTAVEFRVDKVAPLVSLMGVTWQNTSADAMDNVLCTDTISGCDPASVRFLQSDSIINCPTAYSSYVSSNIVTSHKYVCAAQKDYAGNVTTTGASIEYQVDLVPPETALGMTWDSPVLTGTTATAMWTWNAVDDVVAQDIVLFSDPMCLTISDVALPAIAYNATSAQIDFSATLETVWAYRISRTDVAGNETWSECSTILERNVTSASTAVTDVGGVSGDAFGTSSSVSQRRLVVGAPSADIGVKTDAGALVVFSWNGAAWVRDTKLFASDYSSSSVGRFGSSVSIDGDFIVSGAPSAAGAVYAYNWTGAVWRESKLPRTVRSSTDNFGTSVSLNGRFLAAGAPGANAVLVYEWNGTDWGVGIELASPAVASKRSRFGASVALSGNFLLVGDYGYDGQRGQAYLYQRTADRAWTLKATINPTSPAANARFGYAVAVSGRRGVIGSPGAGANMGQIEVLAWSGSSALTVVNIPMVPVGGPSAGDAFGSSVAMSGNLMIVGSPNRTETNTNAGAAYIFTLSGTTWSQTAKWTNSLVNAYMGSSVSVFGNTAISGATGENGNRGRVSVWGALF